MCPVMCVYFISFGRFIFVCVYRISEVLSSWRLGTKVKHAVNNVDSALNFVTGFFLLKKFSQEDFTLHGPVQHVNKNTGHQKQNLTLKSPARMHVAYFSFVFSAVIKEQELKSPCGSQ